MRDAIHRVTVTDATNEPIFTHIGFDLNYVYDFAMWQGRLVFATGNGLYVAQPGTDELTCVMNDLDLEFFSLCPVGDKLFVGTNRGLHRTSAEVFAQLTAQGIGVLSMRNKVNRLEELFMKLVEAKPDQKVSQRKAEGAAVR